MRWLGGQDQRRTPRYGNLGFRSVYTQTEGYWGLSNSPVARQRGLVNNPVLEFTVGARRRVLAGSESGRLGTPPRTAPMPPNGPPKRLHIVSRQEGPGESAASVDAAGSVDYEAL